MAVLAFRSSQPPWPVLCPLDHPASVGCPPPSTPPSGALPALVSSFRHSLRFRAQLLCQLALLTALLQAEMVRAQECLGP